jgi:hypothetical protein
MRDKRRVQRTRALKGAKIILNNHSSVFDCTVHNLTVFRRGIRTPFSG